ncbi:MAG: hypothetical protein JHD16_15070 [Solirubrobacteraceae bacterium]|nr:hypothetical protein [Solirubrobacteraceae bacterium]
MRSAPVPVLIVAACCAAAPTAQAAVSTPTRVSPSGQRVQDQAVGAGGGRTAVLMSAYTSRAGQWKYGVYARIGTPRRIGPLQRLAGRQGRTPSIAVGADGTAVAAWVESRIGPRVSIAPPGRPFGPVRQLTATTASAPSPRPTVTLAGVAVTSAGRAVVTWRAGSSVEAATADAGRRFRSTAVLGTSRTYMPTITVGLAGTAVVGWIDTPEPPQPNSPGPGRGALVQATTLLPSQTAFQTPTTLATLGYWGSSWGALGTGPSGAVVTWTQATELRVSRAGLTGEFSAPSSMLPSTRNSFGVATENDGATTVLWRTLEYAGAESDTVSRGAVYASTLPLNAGPTPAQTLSGAGWVPGNPQVAALASRTLAAWGETRTNRTSRLRVAIHRPGQPWQTLPTVRTENIELFTVRAAGSAHHGAITWVQNTSGDERSGPLYLATYRP